MKDKEYVKLRVFCFIFYKIQIKISSKLIIFYNK